LKTDYFNYRFSYAELSDVGKRRKKNEDRNIICPEIGFFGVSDGMGGLRFGEETAQLVSSTMPEAVKQFLQESGGEISPVQAAEHLKQAIKMVSDNIFDTGNKSGRFDFGATLSCVLLVGDHAVFGNLGDSRGYVIRRSSKHGSRQVTTDHNLASLLVKHGEITKEEAKDHYSSSQLMRFMGMEHPAEPDVFIVKLEKEDKILLCSDGLHGMLLDEEIYQIVLKDKSSEEIVRMLIDAANAAGGKDNISSILIKKSHKKHIKGPNRRDNL